MDWSDWSNFAVASVGIAGALTGLLFVALSLNLDFILDNGHLPARAGTALATLLAIAVVNLLVLAPGWHASGFGVASGVCAVALLAFVLSTCRATLVRRQPGDPLAWVVQPLVINLVTPALLVALGVQVARGAGLGLLPVVTICGLITAVWEAWVLVIEIRR